MTTPSHLAASLLLSLSLSACSSTYWERSFYEGARQGADNAARQPGPRAVPQTDRLPSHHQYERERLRLQGATPTDSRPPVADAAASAAAR